jgi:hypothetical protein
MEFNLDFLRNAGEALSSFGKKEEDKDYSNTSKEDQKSTTESVTPIVLKKDDDEKTVDEESAKVIKTTEDKKKESASDLEKKLANIEKVIDKFSGGQNSTFPSSKELVGNSNSNINIKPLDFGQMQAKANQQEYLKPSNVQNDRIALLYKDLKKYNLI